MFLEPSFIVMAALLDSRLIVAPTRKKKHSYMGQKVIWIVIIFVNSSDGWLKSFNPVNSDFIWHYLGSIKLPEPFWTATKLKLKKDDNPDAETVFEFEIGKSIVSTTAFSLIISKIYVSLLVWFLLVTFIIILPSIQI